MLPITPIYANWQDAYYQLSKTVCHFNFLNIYNFDFSFQEQLKRGSGFFNRAVFGTIGLPTPGTPIPNA
jgi:hypothetical protein